MTDLETLACRLREAAFPYSTSWFTVSGEVRARWLRVARETQRHADASVRRALLSAAEMADETGQPEAAKMLRDCVGDEATAPIPTPTPTGAAPDGVRAAPPSVDTPDPSPAVLGAPGGRGVGAVELSQGVSTIDQMLRRR